MATSKSRKRAPKGASLHVAVVVAIKYGSEPADGDLRLSFGRPDGGDWASFVDPKRDVAVGKAIKARNAWGASRYEILVGTLDAVVEVPTVFALRSIK